MTVEFDVEVLRAQLRATLSTLEAAASQVEAQLLALGEDAEEEADPDGCPRCKAPAAALARAGAVLVCGSCGANIRAGEVIGG